MPLSMCERLSLSELKLTTMTLQFADHFVRYSLGILEDIPVMVGNFIVHVDFVVLEMNEILGSLLF